MRLALARALGIEQRELGWAVQKNQEDGIVYIDIYLFDTAAVVPVTSEPPQCFLKNFSSKPDRFSTVDIVILRVTHAYWTSIAESHSRSRSNRALDWLDDEFFELFVYRKSIKFTVKRRVMSRVPSSEASWRRRLGPM